MAIKFISQTKFFLLYLLVFLLFGEGSALQAQRISSRPEIEETSLSRKEKEQLIPKYVTIGLGFNKSIFRDFATSPLFYNGTVLQISLSQLKIDENRESELGFSFDFGAYAIDFNEHTSTSEAQRIELSYSKLYGVSLFNSEKITSKVGFLLAGNGNLRINGDLQNNAVGFDIFANLLGSVKITKDISRKAAKQKKFLFWRYTLHERNRHLAFRLNLGLVNTSYRNGYAYSGQSSVLNDLRIFDDYEFKAFSGFRASSRLDYSYHLKNKNALQFSYLWDAYSTGGDTDKFEMAHHVLRFSLFFNTNNR